MKKISFHTLGLGVLHGTVVAALLVLWIRSSGYYATSLAERPFHKEFFSLKPSGTLGHGFGVAGTLLIAGGVAMYSTRKRLRAVARTGSIRYFLDVHIFLCLLGPTLILYHTTFKFGGLVGVCFWSMAAVVASGFVGRYLYAQIPRGIKGDALTLKELEEESARLIAILRTEHGLTPVQIAGLDALHAAPAAGSRHPAGVVWRFVKSDLSRRGQAARIRRSLELQGVGRAHIRACAVAAGRRLVLSHRIALLREVQHLFHYWHVIHVPFTIIMFVTLAVHVGVALAFGYTWVF